MDSSSDSDSSSSSSSDPFCSLTDPAYRQWKDSSEGFHQRRNFATHLDHSNLRGRLRQQISSNSGADSDSSDSDYYDHPASWFNSLKRFVQETDVSSLDLSCSGLTVKEVASVLEYLANSQVKELNLSGRNLKNEMESLSKLLIKTKVEKLNVSECRLKHSDVLSLMEALKDTHITDLDISKNEMKYYKDDGDVFVSHLLKSHVTVLSLAETLFFCRFDEAISFIKALHGNPLTHLNLRSTVSSTNFLYVPHFFEDDAEKDTSGPLLSLFGYLKYTSITHFNFAANCIGLFSLKKLGNSLRESKLEELDLSDNDIDDDGADSIFEALVGSKITSLNLASNSMRGLNNLGCFLKKTCITTLDLSKNYIDKPNMFSFPHFLKDSAVTSLTLDECALTDEIGEKLMASLKFSKLEELSVCENFLRSDSLLAFARTVKHTKITDFHFSGNCKIDSKRSCGIALDVFGRLVTKSSLKHVDISLGFYSFMREGNSYECKDQRFVFAMFLESIKNCSVTSVNMSIFALKKIGGKLLSPCLVNASFTHLNLSFCLMEESFPSLAANLKFSAITHLNLTKNDIKDTGVEALAKYLKETKLIDLNLSRNMITCRGATALALALKGSDICSLDLYDNKIDHNGMKMLEKHAETTLITTLEAGYNRETSVMVETVIWNNRRLVKQLVSFFKRIASETRGSILRFEGLCMKNIDTFVEECLSFYKIVVERSSVASILAREESIALSKDQITTLLFDLYPQQFSIFVASQIEVDLPDQIKILRRAEELGLSTIVKRLLIHRPIYVMDKGLNFLHPYTYKLLNKYKLPICNLDVDPQGFEKIIKYFSSFVNPGGASGCMFSDVISMLKDLSEAAKKRPCPPPQASSSNDSPSEGPVVKKRIVIPVVRRHSKRTSKQSIRV